MLVRGITIYLVTQGRNLGAILHSCLSLTSCILSVSWSLKWYPLIMPHITPFPLLVLLKVAILHHMTALLQSSRRLT